jgi:hypothetical protein
MRPRMYLIQCEHEYNTSKNVEKEKYHCEEVMDLMATSILDLEDFNLQSSFWAAGHAGSNIEDHPGDNEDPPYHSLSSSWLHRPRLLSLASIVVDGVTGISPDLGPVWFL